MYMTALVDRLATDLAAVLCHLQPEISLRAAVTVALSVFMDQPKRLTADPDVEAEKFNSLCHFFFLLMIIHRLVHASLMRNTASQVHCLRGVFA